MSVCGSDVERLCDVDNVVHSRLFTLSVVVVEMTLSLAFSFVHGVLNLSSSLSDGMVLQRAPAASIVWGFASPGLSVQTTFQGKSLMTKADAHGVWRQALPPTPASGTGQLLQFNSSEGYATLKDVLFGEVFLCSGQSNMAYTPLSMAGMNNASAEIAAADSPGYNDIRLFTVGQGTVAQAPLDDLKTVYHNWTSASAKVVGGVKWKEFSAICWLFGKRIHDTLQVPVGLISSNWAGTSIQVWMPTPANEACQQGNWSGDRYNALIAPFTVGPMSLSGVIWYQGESNNGQGRYYECAFPAMITAWRAAFQRVHKLWFGCALMPALPQLMRRCCSAALTLQARWRRLAGSSRSPAINMGVLLGQTHRATSGRHSSRLLRSRTSLLRRRSILATGAAFT